MPGGRIARLGATQDLHHGLLAFMASLTLLSGCGDVACDVIDETGSQNLTVSAAVSLTETMQALAGQFERQTGIHVIVNTGPSNALARQIAEGAPVDLFISADEAQMDYAAAAGRIVADTRVDLLSNRLAIVVPHDRARRFESARDLLDPSIRRIAIGNSAAVPAGVYARAYLQRAGVWDQLGERLVETTSVRAALAAVEAGEADAAIVYRTDVRSASRVSVALEVPADQSPTIAYPAALVAGGQNLQGARRFLGFLRSPEAWPTFERAGFLRPGS